MGKGGGGRGGEGEVWSVRRKVTGGGAELEDCRSVVSQLKFMQY